MRTKTPPGDKQGIPRPIFRKPPAEYINPGKAMRSMHDRPANRAWRSVRHNCATRLPPPTKDGTGKDPDVEMPISTCRRGLPVSNRIKRGYMSKVKHCYRQYPRTVEPVRSTSQSPRVRLSAGGDAGRYDDAQHCPPPSPPVELPNCTRP